MRSWRGLASSKAAINQRLLLESNTAAWRLAQPERAGRERAFLCDSRPVSEEWRGSTSCRPWRLTARTLICPTSVNGSAPLAFLTTIQNRTSRSALSSRGRLHLLVAASISIQRYVFVQSVALGNLAASLSFFSSPSVCSTFGAHAPMSTLMFPNSTNRLRSALLISKASVLYNEFEQFEETTILGIEKTGYTYTARIPRKTSRKPNSMRKAPEEKYRKGELEREKKEAQPGRESQLGWHSPADVREDRKEGRPLPIEIQQLHEATKAFLQTSPNCDINRAASANSNPIDHVFPDPSVPAYGSFDSASIADGFLWKTNNVPELFVQTLQKQDGHLKKRCVRQPLDTLALTYIRPIEIWNLYSAEGRSKKSLAWEPRKGVCVPTRRNSGTKKTEQVDPAAGNLRTIREKSAVCFGDSCNAAPFHKRSELKFKFSSHSAEHVEDRSGNLRPKVLLRLIHPPMANHPIALFPGEKSKTSSTGAGRKN
nr:hypothetical protein Iba_chr14cCG15150 [Ipomoea batatas]